MYIQIAGKNLELGRFSAISLLGQGRPSISRAAQPVKKIPRVPSRMKTSKIQNTQFIKLHFIYAFLFQ